MKRFVLFVLLCVVIGCAPRPGSVKPPPTPADGDPLITAAEQSLREYGTGLARVARETAARAESFHHNAEVYDAIEKGSAEVHTRAFAPLGEAADQAVKPDAPYDAAAVRRMLESEAAGFERAVRIQK